MAWQRGAYCGGSCQWWWRRSPRRRKVSLRFWHRRLGRTFVLVVLGQLVNQLPNVPALGFDRWARTWKPLLCLGVGPFGVGARRGGAYCETFDKKLDVMEHKHAAVDAVDLLRHRHRTRNYVAHPRRRIHLLLVACRLPCWDVCARRDRNGERTGERAKRRESKIERERERERRRREGGKRASGTMV